MLHKAIKARKVSKPKKQAKKSSSRVKTVKKAVKTQRRSVSTSSRKVINKSKLQQKNISSHVVESQDVMGMGMMMSSSFSFSPQQYQHQPQQQQQHQQQRKMFRFQPAFFSTTTTTNHVIDETNQSARKHLNLTRVLTDLQLESMISTMQSPPELPTMVALHAQTGEMSKEIELYHLTILSAQDFRTLVPNDINRNRLKDYVRHVIHQPLVSDGAEPVTMEQFNELMQKFASDSIIAAEPTIEQPAAVAAAAASTVTPPVVEEVKTDATKPVEEVKTTVVEEVKVDTATTPAAAATTVQPTTTETKPVEPVVTEQAQKQEEEALIKAEKELAQATLKSAMTSLNMPSFFDNMTQGTLLQWHVKIGEHFDRGHVLCDIDTDIAELSFEAPEPGHLSEILVHANETTKVGKPIAIMKYTEDTDKL